MVSSIVLRRPPWAALEELEIEGGGRRITCDRNEVEKASADSRSHALLLFHHNRSGSEQSPVSCGGASRGVDSQVHHPPCCAIIANAQISKFAQNGEGQCAPVTAEKRRIIRA